MDTSKLDFTGQAVLITGASRGIGKAAALMFAAHGAKVAINYQRNQAAAEQTLSEMTGSGHLLVQADIADPAAVKAMIDTVVRELGGLDVLVNNAGIYEEHPPATVDYATWQDHWTRTIGVNLIGAANAAYCAAQVMIARGGGRIINVSSRGAFRGEPDAPAYGASKAGMNSMSQSMAKALAPQGVYVYAVAPGWIETEMAADYLTGAVGDAIRGQSPLNRVGTADEIAYPILFLASKGTEFMTGAVLDANGASYLRT